MVASGLVGGVLRVLFLILLSSLFAFSSQLQLDNKQTSFERLDVEYFVDKKAKMGIQEAIIKKSEFRISNTGRLSIDYDDAVWFRFVLHSNINDVSRWMLYHSIIPIDRLEFYCIRTSGEIQKFVTGDLVEFRQKQVPSRYQTLFFELKPNETIEIFVKAKNQGRITPDFVLSPAAAFIEKNSNENLIWGIYFGFFIAMIFYNFWLFVSLKDKLYGIYTANIAAMFAMMLIAYGFVQPMLPEWLIIYVDISSRFFGALAPTLFVVFLIIFFDTKIKYKKIHRLLLFALTVLILHCMMYAIDTFVGTIWKSHFIATFIASFFYVSLILFVSAYMLYKREMWAKYIFAVCVINSAWVLLLTFSFIGIVDESGIVEKVGLAKNFLHVAILSTMLGVRFSWIKNQKEISEKLFAEQSKRSVAGDMVANITHQWKQPIAELASILSAVKADIKTGKLDTQSLQNDCQDAFNILNKMAFSVDFFQDFFGLESKVEKIELVSVVQSAVFAFSHTFDKLNIDISVQKLDDITVFADRNVLLQLFSIILQNSKEAFEEAMVQKPRIKINLYLKDGFAIVDIADNAGGCNENILGKIFEPFFGTKKSSTGSGLYLAKIIAEQKINGFINAHNDREGLVINIGLPYSRFSL